MGIICLRRIRWGVRVHRVIKGGCVVGCEGLGDLTPLGAVFYCFIGAVVRK